MHSGNDASISREIPVQLLLLWTDLEQQMILEICLQSCLAIGPRVYAT